MALGDGIRRNIAQISTEERNLFVAAIRQMDNPASSFVFPNNFGNEAADASGNITYWDMMEQIHKDGHAHGLDVHAGPAFIPWHRAIVNHMEELLRQVDPRLSLHYWDWTTDPRVATADSVAILGPGGFMGSDNGDAGVPFQDFESTEGGGHSMIWRNLASGAPAIDSDATILAATNFTDFENLAHNAHDTVHSAYIRGTIGQSHYSFHDPFVFLLHSNLDRLWATWQRMPGHADRLDTSIDPATGTARAYGNILADTGNPSSYFDEFVEPWAGQSGGTTLEPWRSDPSKRILVHYKDAAIIIPASYDTSPHSSYIVTERDTFSTYELQTTLSYPQAFQVIYDGFTPDEIGLPGAAPVINFLDAPNGSVIASINVATPPVVVAENPARHDIPQRITYTFDVNFTNSSAFPVLPADTRDIYLRAMLGGQVDLAPIRLTNQPNPYMIDVMGGNPSWLSTDVRVFQLRPGEAITGSSIIMADPDAVANAPYSYIQSLLGEFRAFGNSPALTFENIPQDEEASQLELSRTVNDGTSNIRVLNFAVAKVRYRATSQPATDVRVFFRTFNTMVSALDYHTDTNYRRRADGNIPLPGLIGSEVASIPYFAEARVSSALQSDNTNRQTINASGGEAFMYFGCWLDFNQPSAQIDTPGGTVSIMSLVRGIHQCLVAEIRFQPGATDPIFTGATPSSSDHLAQRNLAIVESDNPGIASTHVVQHTVLIKPSKISDRTTAFKVANLEGTNVYDELAIRWNNLPRDTRATLFFPEWNVDQVLTLAASLRQSPQLLKKVDANTIECTIGDITYIPIPGVNVKPFAGLITLQLPQTVRDGQLFTVDVQQHSGLIVGRTIKERDNNEEGNKITYSISKRKVLGAFRLTIPVKMGTGLLRREIRNLAVLRYIALSIPVNDRWYPIFVKYIGQIADKVKGLGVDPTLIKPSADDPGIPGDAGNKKEQCFTGKICEVIYNCFGDFEGLALDSCCSGKRHFTCSEKGIEEISLRACKERLPITICIDGNKICKMIIHS